MARWHVHIVINVELAIKHDDWRLHKHWTGQESGRGRARVLSLSGDPVMMETGVRADHETPAPAYI